MSINENLGYYIVFVKKDVKIVLSLISRYPIFYVTPDPARAVGLQSLFSDFHVICYDDKPIINFMEKKGVDVFSFEREVGTVTGFIRNSGKMLEHPEVQKFIDKRSNKKKPAILFFKPSYKIDLICKRNGYLKIGNSVTQNRIFEDKIEFFRLCQRYKWPIPQGVIGKLKNFSFEKLRLEFSLPFVVQFGRGWAGNTTFFIDSRKHWTSLLKKWKEKEVKVSKMVNGPTFLNNACVCSNEILVSKPAVQLPPFPGLENNLAATFGRQWPSGLTRSQTFCVEQLTKDVGRVMRSSGYKGWFGLDFILDGVTGEILLSENNARLTASTTFYTQLENGAGKGRSMLYYHANQFLGKKFEINWSEIDYEASQFVYRNFSLDSKTIKKSLSPGIYSRSMQYLRDGSSVRDLKDEDEILILSPTLDEIISPGLELYTIEYKGRILDRKETYLPWFLDVATKVNQSLVLN